jgi:beta-glucosidase
VTSQIKNTGTVYGADIPQLYIGFPTSAQEPPKILSGLDKIKLQPDQKTTIVFVVDVSRELSVWDTPSKSWRIANGAFNAYVGASSRDIRLQGSLASKLEII